MLSSGARNEMAPTGAAKALGTAHAVRKGSVGTQRAVCRPPRAVLPHAGNCIRTIALLIKGKAGVRILKME